MPIYPKHKEAVCGDCEHFCRHYVRDGSRYTPLSVGHCIRLRSKDREDGTACSFWTPKRGK